jgi:hypothetical protein
MTSEVPGASEAELVELVGLDKRKLSGPLRELVADGSVERAGAGRKGDPFRYFRAAEKAAPKRCPEAGAAPALEMLPLPVGGQHQETETARCPGAESNGWKREAADAFIERAKGAFPGSHEIEETS